MSETPFADFLAMVLDAAGKGKFEPYFDVREQADAIDVYWENEADYSERLNERVTLFRALDDRRVVGCRIKGVLLSMANEKSRPE